MCPSLFDVSNAYALHHSLCGRKKNLVDGFIYKQSRNGPAILRQDVHDFVVPGKGTRPEPDSEVEP